jgi:hypothetical protein
MNPLKNKTAPHLRDLCALSMKFKVRSFEVFPPLRPWRPLREAMFIWCLVLVFFQFLRVPASPREPFFLNQNFKNLPYSAFCALRVKFGSLKFEVLKLFSLCVRPVFEKCLWLLVRCAE